MFTAVTQGLGLSIASGGGLLAPLLVSALARSDAGVDFSGTSYAFVEATWFLALLLALNVAAFGLRRRRPEEHVAAPLLIAAQAAIGGILFAASLAQDGRVAWPGLVAGGLVAVLTVLVVRDVLGAARGRADGPDPAFLDAVVEAAALVLVGLTVLVPSISIPALAALLWLAAGRRRRATRKHAGLRVLR